MLDSPAGARFRPLLVLGAWYLALGILGRVVLWAAFGRNAGVRHADYAQGDFLRAAIARHQTACELFASRRYDLGEGVTPL